MTNGLANHSAHKTNGSDLLVLNLDETICLKTRSQQSKLLLYSDYPVAWLTAACATRGSEGTTYVLRRAFRAASECGPSADLVIKTLTRSGSFCSKRCSAKCGGTSAKLELERREVGLRFVAESADDSDRLGAEWRIVGPRLAVRELRPPRPRRLRRAHDRPSLVDPHAARHVHDTEELVAQMSFVNEGRMIGHGRFDPWARCDRPSAVKRDGHDLEALRPQDRSQLLPHGQAESAPSPRRPRDQQDLVAAQRRQPEGSPIDTRQLELRHARGRERVAT